MTSLLLASIQYSLSILSEVRCKHGAWEEGGFQTMKSLVKDQSANKSVQQKLSSCSGNLRLLINKGERISNITFSLFQSKWNLKFKGLL